nr:putative gamma subunit of citrate lyase [Weissella paramesenteroides]
MLFQQQQYVQQSNEGTKCFINNWCHQRPNNLLISIWTCCRSVLKEEKRLMEIRKSAVAGTLESSDVQIMLSAGNNGIEFELVSDVAKQFGDAIKETITDVLNTYGVTDAAVSVVDKGALDMVIRARAIAVVQRALDIVDTPNWEVL